LTGDFDVRRRISAIMIDRIGLFGRIHRASARRESNDLDVPGMRVCWVVRPSTAQPAWVGPNGPAGGSGRAEDVLEADVGEGEFGLVGTTRGDGKVDATRAGAHLGTEPEQLEANPKCPWVPSGSGATMACPSGATPRSRR
jgi:hypothetical protein